MKKQWVRISGNQVSLKKTRTHLEPHVSTFVLDSKKTFYVQLPRVELKWLSKVVKDLNVEWRKVAEAPTYSLTMCGQWSTAVGHHQSGCLQCREMKASATDSTKQEPEPVNTHGVMATPVAFSVEETTNETLTTGATENTLEVLQTLIKTATEHKDEYMALASKWERYQNALEEVCEEIVSSARRLKEAKAEYEASAKRVAGLLAVEGV